MKERNEKSFPVSCNQFLGNGWQLGHAWPLQCCRHINDCGRIDKVFNSIERNFRSVPSSSHNMRSPSIQCLSKQKSAKNFHFSFSLSSFAIRNAINLFSIHGNIIGFDLDIKFLHLPCPNKNNFLKFRMQAR